MKEYEIHEFFFETFLLEIYNANPKEKWFLKNNFLEP